MRASPANVWRRRFYYVVAAWDMLVGIAPRDTAAATHSRRIR